VRKRSLNKFWDDDDSLSVFLWLLVIFVFVVSPFSEAAPRFRVLIDIGFSVVLISGLAATIQSRRMARLAIAVVLLAAGSSCYEIFFELHSLPIQIAAKTCDLIALILLLVVLLKQTLKAGPITPHRVKGAMATYIVFGVLWAKLYHLTALIRPAAFSGLNENDPFLSLLYFSFVTLTTLGYGDILPTDVFTRSLANAEALVGQLFPAVFIARLVSMQIDARKG